MLAWPPVVLLGPGKDGRLQRQLGDGNALAALVGFSGAVGAHQGVARQHLAHGLTQGAGALAVNDPQLALPFQEGLVKIFFQALQGLVYPQPAQVDLGGLRQTRPGPALRP